MIESDEGNRRFSVLGVILIAMIVIAGASLFWSQMPSRAASHTSQQTSLTSQSTTTVQSWATSSTITSSTTLAETVNWINITGNRPVSYYLGLLESNGTEPYVQLATELRKLTNATNATAVAKITYLALNATNPEVKEAFELMMKGGTPASSDFTYAVPNYNTELEVLYWLALQNGFKKDDTLALAIAMDNGLWVTMGDDEVFAAVRNDTSNLLAFLRETNQLQEEQGYYLLENYPLEAKIVLGWTGGESPDVAKSHALSLFLDRQLDLKSYHWDFTSVDTYRKMQAFMTNEGLLSQSASETLKNLMHYFSYFQGKHWVYTLHGGPSQTITVNGEAMGNYMYGSTNYCFAQFLSDGKVSGVSYDHLSFIDSLLQSVGIASTHLWLTSSHKPPGQAFNDFNLVFVPEDSLWKADPEEVTNVAWKGTKLVPGPLNESHLVLFKPPVDERGYLIGIARDREDYSACTETNFCDMLYPEYSKAYTSILGSSYENGIPFDKMQEQVVTGLPTSQMKQCLLYSGPTSRVY